MSTCLQLAVSCVIIIRQSSSPGWLKMLTREIHPHKTVKETDIVLVDILAPEFAGTICPDSFGQRGSAVSGPHRHGCHWLALSLPSPNLPTVCRVQQLCDALIRTSTDSPEVSRRVQPSSLDVLFTSPLTFSLKYCIFCYD